MDKVAWGKFAHYHYDETDLDQFEPFLDWRQWGYSSRRPLFRSIEQIDTSAL